MVDLGGHLVANNPEAMGDGEKKLWAEIEPVICELLDELKANGKIETAFIPIETEHLRNVISNLYQLGINTNWLIHLPDQTKQFQKFLALSAEFGFDESKYVSFYVQSSVLSVILHTELFKVYLLFHLKDVEQKPSKFPNIMESFAPNAWAKLKPYVDSQFRNALAHGTWAIENKQIVLFEDASLVPFERLDLDKFIIRAKNQNILYVCLVSVIDHRARKGFFK